MPNRLTPTPRAFLAVIGSLTKKKAKNIVNIGPRVDTIEVSTGVDILIARRKEYCVMNRPKNDATTILQRSLKGTFSFGRNREISQKRREAPRARMVKSAMGETTPALAISLVETMFIPKIEYAARRARCPVMSLFPLILRLRDWMNNRDIFPL